MDTQRIIHKIRTLQNDNLPHSDNQLTLLIEMCQEILLSKLYPFHEEKTTNDIPNKFENWIVRAVISMILNSEHEGILAYSENGLKITFAEVEASIDKGLMNEIIPYSKVL